MNDAMHLFDAPGPRGKKILLGLNIFGIILVVAIAWWVLATLIAGGHLAASAWKPFATWEVWSIYLLPGLWATLKAAFIAIITSNVLGLILGVGRLSAIAPIRWVCGLIVEFFRAVPVLVMMIFFYFSLSHLANSTGMFDADQAPFIGVVLGLTMYNGTVIAELVRSGVSGLSKGQREAALSVGLRGSQSLRYVELPQALIAMMPAMVSQLVVILKDTALGYIVLYPELLRQAKLVGTSYSSLLPALVVAAAMFIVVNTALGYGAQYMSTRLNRRAATSQDTLADPGLLIDAD